jgi:cbb3-type cytochrome oxidase cytochrome c subunit
MNHGPLIFLGAFFAMAASWFGLVLKPQMQVGHFAQSATFPAGDTYPQARPGLAREGLEVYRANGCASCHSQQVRQSGTGCDLVLKEAGTNRDATISVLLSLKPGLNQGAAADMLSHLPKSLLEGVSIETASAGAKALAAGGGKAEVLVVPQGVDIARGWGRRRSVAEDFLFDNPVMLGSQRVGPDLANVGARLADTRWQLNHLYAPRMDVKNSVMPPYRYLFETRRIEKTPSPNALTLPADQAPGPGLEVVPKQEAIALVAYLTSLRSDEPLFETPLTVVSSEPAPGASTNAVPGASATNAAPAITPAK